MNNQKTQRSYQKAEEANLHAVDEHEVSRMTGLAVQTIRNQRCSRKNTIPYLKIGRSVRYLVKDVFEYLEKHRIDPEGSHAVR